MAVNRDNTAVTSFDRSFRQTVFQGEIRLDALDPALLTILRLAESCDTGRAVTHGLGRFEVAA